MVVAIVRVARRLRNPWWALALGLLLGGALGNLVDRLFRAPAPLRGHVVDWIHLHHWPVFNLADSGDRRRRGPGRAALPPGDVVRRGRRRSEPGTEQEPS